MFKTKIATFRISCEVARYTYRVTPVVGPVYQIRIGDDFRPSRMDENKYVCVRHDSDSFMIRAMRDGSCNGERTLDRINKIELDGKHVSKDVVIKTVEYKFFKPSTARFVDYTLQYAAGIKVEEVLP